MSSSKLQLKVEGYVFDFSNVCQFLRDKRVLLEAPQGWIRLLDKIALWIRTKCGAKICYLRLDPAFGGCDIGYVYAKQLGVDVIVHVGHTTYPLCPQTKFKEVEVYYVPGYYVENMEVHVNKIIRCIGDSKKVAIAYVVQHKQLVNKLIQMLGGKLVLTEQILGCWYGMLPRIYTQIDKLIVIGGGLFHALGLCLAVGDCSKVLVFDPFDDRRHCISVCEQYQKVLMKRLWLLEELRSKKLKRVAVLVGLKTCQFRQEVIESIRRMLETSKVDYDLYINIEMSREKLFNMEPWKYDAIIVTSCPRLAIDDYGDMRPPLLTPGELKYVLGFVERYVFPW